MRVRPVRLNAAIAWLFMVGSACFVLGSVPAYVSAVGAWPDAATYFVGSLFFTSASWAQLVQSQSPDMSEVDQRQQNVPARLVVWAWLPTDCNWLAAATQFPGTLFFNISTVAALAANLTVQQQDRRVWTPDIFGSTLFLVSSTFALLALGGRVLTLRPDSLRWWIGWLNMAGSVAFMFSALASFVLPRTGDLISQPVATAGTFVGAACFLVGAALLLPAGVGVDDTRRPAE
jgi:hypothetical protein